MFPAAESSFGMGDELTMARDCPVCTSATGPSFQLEKNGYRVNGCADCEHLFVDPVPTSEELAEVYSLDGGYMPKAEAMTRAPIPAKFVERLGYLRQHRKQGRLLDVGCSFGQLLRAADEAGFEPVGVEMNLDTAALARSLGFDVVEGALEQAGFEEGSFDVVHLGDLIEHVPDVFGLLSEVRRVLRGDGVVILTTPNHDAFFPRATRRFGRWVGLPWSHATPPHHLHQFSCGSLDRLFDRVGLERVDIRYEPILLRYEIGATLAPQSLKRAVIARRPIAALRYAVASGFAVAGYSTLALLERLLPPSRPRGTMSVIARVSPAA